MEVPKTLQTSQFILQMSSQEFDEMTSLEAATTKCGRCLQSSNAVKVRVNKSYNVLSEIKSYIERPVKPFLSSSIL